MGGGLLTGKYGQKIESSQNRLGNVEMYKKRYGDDWMLDAAIRYEAFARDNNINPVSLAVAWVAAHPGVTAPILGARNVGQLADALRSVEIDMTPELYQKLASLTPAPAPATDRTEDFR